MANDPPADIYNPNLTRGPALLCMGEYSLDNGDTFGVLTVRTSSATVTVLLTKEEMTSWAATIKQAADNLPAAPALLRPQLDTAAINRSLGKLNGGRP